MNNLDPSPQLYLKIINRLHKEEKILAIKKIIFFSTTFILSVAGMFFTVKSLIQNLQTSGFIYYISLLFSDFSIIKAYWQNFLLALLETLPALSITLCLTILLIFMQSIKLLSKNIKIYGYK